MTTRRLHRAAALAGAFGVVFTLARVVPAATAATTPTTPTTNAPAGAPPDLTSNAPLTTDAVPPGEVAVVAASAPVRDRIAFVVQNGSDGVVRLARVTAIAARSGGTQASRASTTSVVPVRLAPGERAIGQVRFRAGSIGLGPVVTWEVRSSRAPSAPDPTRLTVRDPVLSAPQGGAVAQTLRFAAGNPQARPLRGPMVTKVLCLNESGRPAVLTSAKAKRARLAPGATMPVTVALRELCPSWAVGAAAGLPR